MTYFEVYYASTEYSIVSRSDGFGIRTYSEQLPVHLLDKLKESNVFFYDGGSMPLAGSFDLIENPSLVLDYPKTYTFFIERIQEKTYF